MNWQNMWLHITLLRTAVITNFTQEWFLSLMNGQHMRFQIMFQRSIEVTDMTNKWFLFLMNGGTMCSHVLLSSKAFFTNFTFKWFLSLMNHIKMRFKFHTVADYRLFTVWLKLKTLLPCILLLSPSIEVIYYWDYMKKSSCSTKNCNFNSGLPLFQGSNTSQRSILLQVLQVKAVYIWNKVFTCIFWG